MKDRSLLSAAVTLMLMVVASATFLQIVRLHERGSSFADISLYLSLAFLLLILILAIARLCNRISHTRIGRALRAGITVIFVLSVIALLGTAAFIRISAAGDPDYGLPAAYLKVLEISANVSLLTAPVGWRALVDYMGRRSAAAMPFFRASPVILSLAFLLATGVMLAFGTSEFLPTASTSLEAGSLSVAGMALLACLSITIPLILLARLLAIGSTWLGQRRAKH